MLLSLACGAIAQVTLSHGQAGNVYIGRALALMMPIYISGGISVSEKPKKKKKIMEGN